MCDLREVWRLKNGLDDSGVNGQDRQNDAGQEDKRQLVDVLHANKDDHRHQCQAARAVNTHVVEQGVRSILLLLRHKDGGFRHDVSLKKRKVAYWNTCTTQWCTCRSGLWAVNAQAESQWYPRCTWNRRRWFPGRSRDPQLHQTLGPGIWRSCSKSLQL